MPNKEKNFSVTLSSIEIPSNSSKSGFTNMVKMDVEILGTPGLRDIINLMDEIKKISKDIKEAYISVTDLSKLNINSFLERIILHGMESTYKSIVSIENPAKLSFVVLDESQQNSRIMKDSLASINSKDVTSADYKYQYIFVGSQKEIPSLAAKLLNV